MIDSDTLYEFRGGYWTIRQIASMDGVFIPAEVIQLRVSNGVKVEAAATLRVHANVISRLVSRPKSKYRGVTWHKGNQKWMAQIKIDRKLKPLGYFDFQEDAAKAFDVAVINRDGPAAETNFKKGT